MGNDEAVTPVFPNSDYWYVCWTCSLLEKSLMLTADSTGAIGSAAVLHGLLRRAEEGGSYGIDVSSETLARMVHH
jgi:hypothetical protein